jgi:hypothetical protein
MSDKRNSAAGTDWTGLLADTDLVSNLGTLLQAFRDAAPECREQVLLAAMRQIKASTSSDHRCKLEAQSYLHPVPTSLSATPPFEPDIFSTTWGQDRRRHPRIKCFVAVELHVNDAGYPLWGNLSNTSLGGCQVEITGHISGGAKVEIGLWVATGKIWVKGLALNGVVMSSAPAPGVRIRFATLGPTEKENLRQFLK